MARHSAIVGGSTAGRLLNCPGSYQATLALPPSADISSEYAAEGSAMHGIMEHIMRERMSGRHVDLDDLLGHTAIDRVITREHIDSVIAPALEALDELEDVHGGDFSVVGIEQRVRFPGIPGAFGTVDLILQSPRATLVVDWKFGAGVGVEAVYTHPDGDIVNPQLLFYTAAALATKPRFFTGPQTVHLRDRLTIVAAIIQPRGAAPLTHTTISRRELKYFREDIERAVLAALDRDPPRARGEHCRFAPCKVNCPLWTGPLLDLSVLEQRAPSPPPRDGVMTSHDMITPYGVYLAKAKQLVDIVAMYKKTLDEQMHAYMEAGGVVPGWKLKAKAKQRQWIDEDTVYTALTDLGFDDDDIFTQKLVTFQSADATAKRLGVKIPDELRVAPPTTETTMTTIDDPAPAVEPHLAVEQFQTALQMLQASILPDGSVAPTPAASPKKEYLR